MWSLQPGSCEGQPDGSGALTQQGGRFRTFLKLLWWLFVLLLEVLLGPNGHLLGLLRFDRGGNCTVSELVRIIVGLLVLRESEATIHRTYVEDDGDRDVEETEQHHQLAGPVEKVEVDGSVSSHVRG